MTVSLDSLFEQVNAERVKDLCFNMVKISSPTGDSRQVAEFYGSYLNDLGMEVELIRKFPKSPSVVARWKGPKDGPTLILNGHLDTIPVSHAAPHYDSGVIYGRGAADCKGGMAAIAEAAEVIVAVSLPLKGELMVVGHGLHEAPHGYGQDLSALLSEDIVAGDAAIVVEGASHDLPVIQKGMAIFEIELIRRGEVDHEVRTPPGTPNPIVFGSHLVRAIEHRNRKLAENNLPYVGPETFFTGIFQCGDFFNRFPAKCRLVGTRRYHPDKTYEEVKEDFEELIKTALADSGLDFRLTLTKVRDGWRLSEKEAIAEALQSAYQTVTGNTLHLSGKNSVNDASIFIREGRIPTVCHGPKGEGIHGDTESMEVAELVRAAKVYISTAVNYFALT